MPMFRKKPLLVEAMQFDGSAESAAPILQWLNDHVSFWSSNFTMRIQTGGGSHKVVPGDWVVRNDHGGISVFGPDYFSSTYEPT